MITTMNGIEYKHCPKCKRTKKATMFSKNANEPDGLQGWCKKCKCGIDSGWRQANPDYQKKWIDENIRRDTSIIYGIYTVADNKLVYVGETLFELKSRIAKHRSSAFTTGSDQQIHKAMRELGWDAFRFVVIDDTVDFNPVFTEDYFIKLLSPTYNSMSGNKTRQVREEKAA
jgi:hypothetical protein